jgi:hypothetical protein
MNKWTRGSHIKNLHWHFSRRNTKSCFICPTHNESGYGHGAIKTATELLGIVIAHAPNPTLTALYNLLGGVVGGKVIAFGYKRLSVSHCLLFKLDGLAMMFYSDAG